MKVETEKRIRNGPTLGSSALPIRFTPVQLFKEDQCYLLLILSRCPGREMITINWMKHEALTKTQGLQNVRQTYMMEHTLVQWRLVPDHLG